MHGLWAQTPEQLCSNQDVAPGIPRLLDGSARRNIIRRGSSLAQERRTTSDEAARVASVLIGMRVCNTLHEKAGIQSCGLLMGSTVSGRIREIVRTTFLCPSVIRHRGTVRDRAKKFVPQLTLRFNLTPSR